MIKYSKIFFSFLGLLLFSMQVNSQSLSVQTLAGSTDATLGNDDFTSYKALFVDVHDNTGIRVYTWIQSDDPTNQNGHKADHNIYCRIFDKDMNPMTPEFMVNNHTNGDQQYPAVKIDQKSSYFVIAWASNYGPNNYDIYVKKMNLYMTNAPDIVNQGEQIVNINMVDLSTVPYPYTGSQISPYLAFDYDFNELIVAYRDQDGHDNYPATTGASGVYARRIAWSSFTLIKDVFLVNPSTDVVDQQIVQDVRVNPVTGELMVAYQSYTAANNYDVKLRKFTRTSSGDWSGQTELAVNTTTTNIQEEPRIILNSTTGDYIIAWNSYAQDGSVNGSYLRPYDKTGADKTLPSPWVNHEMRINILTTDNQQYPRGVWDEKSNSLLFFYVYSANPNSYYRYQLINASTFVAINGEMPACSTSTGEINALAWISRAEIGYSQQKQQLTLAYQIWNSYSTNPLYSKGRSRSYYFGSSVIDNNTDLNKNWVQETTYNELGVVVSEKRAYADQLGRSTQTQVRNIEDANIIASTNVFDTYGRPSLQTLPAPTNSQSFNFKTDLITAYINGTNVNYDFNYFDKPVTSANAVGEINNPAPVDFTGVGAYYTGSNYVAGSAFPYTRIEYNDKVAGGLVRTANAGNDHVMGSTREVKTIVLPILNELDHYRSTVTGLSPNQAFTGTKQVTIDENGIASIAFKDLEGNLLAKALAGGSRACTSMVTLGETFSYINISTGVSDNINGMRIDGSDVIEVYDITGGVFTLLSSLPQTLASSKTIQIRSKSPFSVYWNSYNNSDPRTATPLAALSVDFTSTSSVDFYLKDLPSLSLTSANGSSINIKILDLVSGNIVYTGLLSSFTNNLVEGFYRLSVEKPPVASTYTSYSLTFAYNFFYSDFSYNFYDIAGRMIAEVAPKGIDFNNTTTVPNFTNTYKFNTLSQIISKTETDAGTTNYVYRRDGKVRFTQNAKQATTGKFSYANYDLAARPVESGEYDNSLGPIVFQTYFAYDASPNPSSVFTILNDVANAGSLGTSCSCRTQITNTTYDIADPSLPGTPTLPAARTQRFLTGRVSSTSNANSTTYYSYDELERLEWTVQNIASLGYKTTDYKYDLNGNVLNVIYQDATSERFEHRYTYDKNQKLKLVETKPGANAYQTEANYLYYLHGPLKRIELANQLQGIDYVYTIQGWLKSINNPSLDNLDPGADGITGSSHAGFGQDVFGMLLEYYNNANNDSHSLGDYGNFSGCSYGLNNSNITTSGVKDYYDGTVKAMRWQTKGHPVSGGIPQYVFQYDNKYQLTNATFGTVARGTYNCGLLINNYQYYVFTANNNFNVSNLNYDVNGNILNKYSTDNAGANLDKFDYNYITNTNKLSSVQNNGSSPVTYYSQYQYDPIGQMTQEISGGITKNLTYNVYKKVTNVTKSNGDNAVYTYNELGYRLTKTTYISGQIHYTYYVNDAAGNVISIYDDRSGTLAQTELPVYGASRLGVAFKSTSAYAYEYELTDHLGNVRATIGRSKDGNNAAVIVNWQDYFPHGQIMPSRQGIGRTATAQRDYQGQDSEKDPETGYNTFDLRMYDSRIGRWLSTDPMGQYWSPYLAMGNNPVSRIDPTGGDDEGGGEGGATGGYGYGGNGGNGNISVSPDGEAYAYTPGGFSESESSFFETGGGSGSRMITGPAQAKGSPYQIISFGRGNPSSSSGGYRGPSWYSGGAGVSSGSGSGFSGAGYGDGSGNNSGQNDFMASINAGNSFNGNNNSGSNVSVFAKATGDTDDPDDESIDWDEVVRDADEFFMAASLADGPIPVGDVVGLIVSRGARLGRLVFAARVLPRSGPIVKSVGAASRSAMLARKLKLNINSPTTRQVLNSLDDTVDDFISHYRKPSIRFQIPGEFLNQTVEEALRSGNTTVRKLLIDSRFVK